MFASLKRKLWPEHDQSEHKTKQQMHDVDLQRKALLGPSIYNKESISAKDLQDRIVYLQTIGCIGGICSPDALANKCQLMSNKDKGHETLEYIQQQVLDLQRVLMSQAIEGLITPRILSCGDKTINSMEIFLGKLTNIEVSTMITTIEQLNEVFQFCYVVLFTFLHEDGNKQVLHINSNYLDVIKLDVRCKQEVFRNIYSMVKRNGKCHQHLLRLMSKYQSGLSQRVVQTWDTLGKSGKKRMEETRRVYPICVDLTFLDPNCNDVSVYPQCELLHLTQEQKAHILENTMYQLPVDMSLKSTMQVLDQLGLLVNQKRDRESVSLVSKNTNVTVVDKDYHWRTRMHVDPEIQEEVNNGTAKYYIVRMLKKPSNDFFKRVNVFGTDETTALAEHAACFIVTKDKLYSLGFGTAAFFDNFDENTVLSSFIGGEEGTQFFQRKGIIANMVDIPKTKGYKAAKYQKAALLSPDYYIMNKIRVAMEKKNSGDAKDPRYVDVIDSGFLLQEHVDRINNLLANVTTVKNGVTLTQYFKPFVFKPHDVAYLRDNSGFKGPFTIIHVIQPSKLTHTNANNVTYICKVQKDEDADAFEVEHKELFTRMDDYIFPTNKSAIRLTMVNASDDVNIEIEMLIDISMSNHVKIYDRLTSTYFNRDELFVQQKRTEEMMNEAILTFQSDFTYIMDEGIYSRIVSHLPNAQCSYHNPGNCSSVMEYIFQDSITCFHKYWQVSHPNACRRKDGNPPQCQT